MTIGIYARLSPKPSGQYEGVEDQIKWGRDYAAKAWPGEPVEVFADAGISAANGDARPDFDRLREWVKADRLSHVWTVEQSRLTRSEVVWFELAAEFDAAGIAEVHTNRDGIVRVYDDVAGIKAVLNAGERRKMLRRQADTLAEKAGRGEPPGVRPFGYAHARTDDGTRTYVVVPEQADIIRFAAERILAGWALTNVAAELNERGVRSTLGGKVVANSVRSWLTAPSVAGLRVHQGQVVGNGNWKPILDRQTFEQVKAKLVGRRTVQCSGGSTYQVGARHLGNATGRRYVLTGLAYCGVCDAPLIGSNKQLKNGTKKPYLQCHPKKGGKSCIGIMLPETEGYVVETMFAALDDPKRLEGLASEDEHQQRRDEIVAELAGIERQRNELAELWGAGELGASDWAAARESLKVRERRLQGELTETPAPQVRVTGAEVRRSWEGLTLDEQRDFMRSTIERVTIHRAKPGTKGFDSNRVEVRLRIR